VGEALLIPVLAVALPSLMGGVASIPIIVAVILGVIFYFHQVVQGIVRTDALYFKRYLKWTKLSWGEIESISRSPMGAISVHLKTGSVFNRRLSFLPNPVLLGANRNYATFDELRKKWLAGEDSATGRAGDA
jgi:hypothetical protein